MSSVVAKAKGLTRKPGIAHLLRANERFSGRLGNQFGAAVTYFSVLAVVPILLFAFSVTGLVLTVINPDALDFVIDQARSALSGFGLSASGRAKVLSFVESSLRNWAAPGIVGVLSALYSGAGWAGNLKNAVRAQTVDNFDGQIREDDNIVIKTLKNLGILLGLLVSIVVTFAVTSISTTLSTAITSFTGLDQIGWLTPALQIVPIFISIAAGWLVFMYLFRVLPEEHESGPAMRRAALIGSIGLAVLQYGSTLVLKLFRNNTAIQLFGPVILVMLFLNLFARLILFTAAWMDTWEAPKTSDTRAEQRSGERGEPAPAAPVDHDQRPYHQGEGGEDEIAPGIRTPTGQIPAAVALRSSRLSLGAGYLTGAATGAGLGALLALGIGKITGRRR